VPNTESVGFHKPLHELPLLLPSAYDKPNLPLLEETVHSPSCLGKYELLALAYPRVFSLLSYLLAFKHFCRMFVRF